MKDKTFIQCCYCKANNQLGNYSHVTFNRPQSINGDPQRLSSFGCSNCKNFNEKIEINESVKNN